MSSLVGFLLTQRHSASPVHVTNATKCSYFPDVNTETNIDEKEFFDDVKKAKADRPEATEEQFGTIGEGETEENDLNEINFDVLV